ncbi:MAG: PQQ-dependent sugar dehydrogenase [Phycisphaerales bacterium]|nr:PQQ-dependent sugar dehydrogenase [Phycisphaerales bacterium]
MNGILRATIAGASVICLGAGSAIGGATPMTSVRVASGLTRPIFLTHAPGDFTQVYIIEKQGIIKTMDLSSGTIATWLNIDALVGGGTSTNSEQGLLGLAFHPDFANNGYFYVDYTNNSGSTQIERRTVDLGTGAVIPGSEQSVHLFSQPEANHNGGWIGFGPDGYLYVGTGDGGGACDQHGTSGNGQNGNSFLGKMLRIDVNGDDFPANATKNYAIPPSNPFVGVGGFLGEIWAYGLRNPWRNSFDRETGDLWMGDVGQGAREEVNFQPASSTGGENYGWRCREGFGASSLSGCSTTGCAGGVFDDPILDYTHASGRCSITGGYVYRGCAMPDMQGNYFYADYCSSTIWSVTYDGSTLGPIVDRTSELVPDIGSIASITSFGEDAFGEIYICDQNGGEIFKIVPAGGVMTDCNSNNIEDACEILSGMAMDANMNGIIDSCEPPACPGDIDMSGGVDVDDLNQILSAFGTSVGMGDPRDLANNDGFVDVDDLNVVLANFGCP